jgi:ATP-dependent exoDNAse (exonuclease V) beta subunit
MTEINTSTEDAAARRQAVAAPDSVLVQAPAGSGKTTLLAQRYLRLLALVDAPERILALTFTRRAAQEMRERVVQALNAASLAACPVELHETTWELAVAARRRMDALQIDIGRHPSRLRIETIDAFNAWLAAQLPITATAGASLRVTENAGPLYLEAARRALAQEEESFGGAVERVLALDDQRWGRLVNLIAEMLPGRDRWLPLLAGRLQAASSLDDAQLQRVRRHFDEDLELLVRRALQSAYDTLGSAAIYRLSPLLEVAAQRLDGQWSEIADWQFERSPLRPEPNHLGRWRGIAAMCLTNGAALRKRLTKAEGFPPDCREKPLMMELLSEFESEPEIWRALTQIRILPEPRYSDADWERVRDVAQVLVLAAAELQQVFREQGMVDFPAVSMAALSALGSAAAPTDLTLRLDYRLQHILIDEFQDTSSAQLELLRLLTAGWQCGDGRTVFCVGDPMQSIYGFRQAEVRAFLELAEDGIGEVKFELQRLRSNFRSARELVNWVNASFARIMPRTDDRDRAAIAFRPSASALVSSSATEPAVSIRGFATRGAEAAAIADLIEARRVAHPEWRIAILVRARAHARELANCLRKRGIGFRALGLEPLQDRAVVRDLITLTRALLHLGDRTAWLALLRAPWAGLTLSDLLTVARARAIVWDAVCDDAVLGRLSEDGAARCRRLRTVLTTAFRLQTHGTLARWVERTWLAVGGPGCAADAGELPDVGAVFARLRELERRGLPDAADLGQSFADLYADGGPSSGVEIMTIHKAKGLEFDMVVVPALARHTRPNRGQLLLTHQFARTGRDGMIMAARPAIGGESDRLFEFLRRQGRDAADLEAQRLLYVACTRAKWQLHLTASTGLSAEPDLVVDPDGEVADMESEAADAGGDAEAALAGKAAGSAPAGLPWKPHPGSLLAVLWPVVEREFNADANAEAEESVQAEEDTGLRGGPLYRLPTDWSSGSCTPFMPGASLATAPREDTPVFDWAGETARRVGSLVHAELQRMDLERSDEAAIVAREAHFKRWLSRSGVPDERLHDAGARVIAALIGVHRDPRGRWILRKYNRDDFREYAVSGRWSGEVVRAVFDRTFVDEHGVRWVIDYKTSQHTGGGLTEFLEREVERYRPQLQRYAMLASKMGAEPVRVGLYFPLMRAWREWAP